MPWLQSRAANAEQGGTGVPSRILIKNPSVRKQNLLLFVDILIIAFALVLLHSIWHKWSFQNLLRAFLDGVWVTAIASLLAHPLLFYVFDLYNIKSYYAMSGRLVRIILSVFFAIGSIIIVSFFLPGHLVIRNVLLLQIPVVILTLYAWRELFFHCIVKRQKKSSILLIGADPLNLKFLDEIAGDALTDYEVNCIVPVMSEDSSAPQSIPLKYKNRSIDSEDIEKIVESRSIDIIAISMPFIKEFNAELLRLSSRGIQVFDTMTLYKLITARVPIENEEYATISIFSGRFPLSSFYRNTKRLIDITLSTIGLIISAPFVLASAILMQIVSPGPVFFRPERVGENGSILRLLKLRTMKHRNGKTGGPLFTQDDDDRVTSVGKIVRKFGFDEFPQLINVLRGEMSLIGPRPIERVFVDDYSRKNPLYYLRTSIKPGISGWAQVNQVEYPNSEKAQMTKLQFDLFYISHASLLLDIVIIFKTLKKFFNFGYDNRKRRAAGTSLVRNAAGQKAMGHALR